MTASHITVKASYSTVTASHVSVRYNYGTAPISITWAGNTKVLAAGDSAVVKPFIELTLSASGAPAEIISIKIAGSANLSVANEVLAVCLCVCVCV
jgi:hypothetical protein